MPIMARALQDLVVPLEVLLVQQEPLEKRGRLGLLVHEVSLALHQILVILALLA